MDANFQAALLELLDRDLTAEEMCRELRTEQVFAEYREYVNGFEPRMLVVAAELVKKWGRRG